MLWRMTEKLKKKTQKTKDQQTQMDLMAVFKHFKFKIKISTKEQGDGWNPFGD